MRPVKSIDFIADLTSVSVEGHASAVISEVSILQNMSTMPVRKQRGEGEQTKQDRRTHWNTLSCGEYFSSPPNRTYRRSNAMSKERGWARCSISIARCSSSGSSQRGSCEREA
eukprot:COSAG05_NODE_842_length_7020_cov_16.612484_3_plen_113_part_00